MCSVDVNGMKEPMKLLVIGGESGHPHLLATVVTGLQLTLRYIYIFNYLSASSIEEGFSITF